MSDEQTVDRKGSGRRLTHAGRRIGSAARVTGRGLGRAARSRATRRIGVALAVVAVSLAGVVLGLLLGARADVEIGPFSAEMSVTPAVNGGTTVAIPPLGSLHVDSHQGPIQLSIQLGSLDQVRTLALLDDPAAITRASQTVVGDVTDGVLRLGIRTIAVAVLTTLILAALVFRDTRRVAWSGTLALLITGGSIGVAALTIRPEAIEEPRYEGLLVNAPAVVGDVQQIASNYNRYAEQLQHIVTNVSRIYTTVSTLPVYEAAEGTTRVLHVSDMHLNPTGWPMIRTVVEQFDIDLVIDTGDMTDWGSEPEATYVASIAQLDVPYVFIRGNHDSIRTQEAVAGQPNAIVLDNEITTVAGLTIAGIGDPRFTPDKQTSPADGGLSRPVAEQVIGVGEQLAATVRGSAEPVDIALVHDPVSAGPLSGTTPLVLAGHTHNREVRQLAQIPGEQSTLLMVEGSTGGAGLRGLEGEEPTPLAMSVLYFDAEQRLQAHDDIKVGGTGQAQVTLERHVIAGPVEPDPVDPSATPIPDPADPGAEPGSPVPGPPAPSPS
ncbi:metallophosphoesterase family protein [Micromonospora sp. NBC_01813]|uniref:metallophosphoesterase family protein n=1 Tax=Micromonospora sp. NBC_01813 TaxID=2975988 RepID=UPI002DDA7A20|nr:metallophosphoesterase [Micromonospora sp. NBC_01813]WSA11908.1 metallophosphoesterase [Micromonospora sp. NBC_01813]